MGGAAMIPLWTSLIGAGGGLGSALLAGGDEPIEPDPFTGLADPHRLADTIVRALTELSNSVTGLTRQPVSLSAQTVAQTPAGLTGTDPAATNPALLTKPGLNIPDLFAPIPVSGRSTQVGTGKPYSGPSFWQSLRPPTKPGAELIPPDRPPSLAEPGPLAETMPDRNADMIRRRAAPMAMGPPQAATDLQGPMAGAAPQMPMLQRMAPPGALQQDEDTQKAIGAVNLILESIRRAKPRTLAARFA